MPAKKPQAQHAPLTGPSAVRLETVHSWGPLARGGTRFSPRRISVTAGGPEPVLLTSPPPAPIRTAGGGTTVDAVLRARLASGERRLAEGDSTDLELTVDGGLPPGAYAAEISLHPQGGEGELRIPVTLAVRAHWIWPFACLLLGLLTLGVVGLLAGEERIGDERARLLEERREFDELVARGLARDLDPLLVRRTEEAFARALAALEERRALSLRDDRVERAAQRREEAARGSEELRSRFAGGDTGELAADRVQAAWEDLGERLAAARERAVGDPASIPVASEQPASLDIALGRFLAGLWSRTVGATGAAIEAALAPEVERVAWAAAAGEQERARRLATLTVRRIQRAARQLDQAVESHLTMTRFAEQMAALAARLATALEDPDLSPQAGQRVRANLVAARRALTGEVSLTDFQEAHRLLQEATVEALAGSQEGLLGRVQSALDEAAERTSLAAIGAAAEGFEPGASPVVKERNLLAVLGLWRQRVQVVEDEERRGRFERWIADVEERVRDHDWPGAAERWTELAERWDEFEKEESVAALASVVVPYCQAQAALLRQDLEAARYQAAALGDAPEAGAIDRQIETLTQRLATIAWDATCQDPLTEISGGVKELGERLFTAGLRRVAAPTEALQRAAEHSGVAMAVAEVRRLLMPVRPLDVDVRTPVAQRLGGYRCSIAIGNLDPVWGAGTRVVVDFGDGSAHWEGDAESLRKTPVLEHRFSRPGRYQVEARATAERLLGAAAGPDDELLGEGNATVEIASDPVSAARRLGDLFFNLRFLLALAVGLLIQGWRLYGDKPFGADRRDYLEAFAIGFASHAGVDGLLNLLPGLLQ